MNGFTGLRRSRAGYVARRRLALIVATVAALAASALTSAPASQASIIGAVFGPAFALPGPPADSASGPDSDAFVDSCAAPDLCEATGSYTVNDVNYLPMGT